MKNCLLVTFSAMILLLNSCRKSSITQDDSTGFSEEIQNTITQETIQKFIDSGLLIHEGKKPPQIAGIYLASPVILTSTNQTNDFSLGYRFDDFKFKFSDQNNKTLRIQIDYKSAPVKHSFESGSGIGGFLAGNNTFFTIFGEVAGQLSGIPYKTIVVYSGEISANTVKIFSWGFYLKEKIGDTGNNYLVPVGTMRTFKDGDNTSPKDANFRKGMPLEGLPMVEDDLLTVMNHLLRPKK